MRLNVGSKSEKGFFETTSQVAPPRIAKPKRELLTHGTARAMGHERSSKRNYKHDTKKTHRARSPKRRQPEDCEDEHQTQDDAISPADKAAEIAHPAQENHRGGKNGS